MTELSAKVGIYKREHCRSNLEMFKQQLADEYNDFQILSLNNRHDIPWDDFPDYRGSHFIRDPRDLIVSGYYYHTWCKEEWCLNSAFDWREITRDPLFKRCIESNPNKFPSNISYQDYLNSVGKDNGCVLELIWRRKHFEALTNWDYKNSNVIEVRYENIIDNEHVAFSKIFKHYGFSKDWIETGLEIVEKHSLKNRAKSNVGHVRNGKPHQWGYELCNSFKELFNEQYGQ